MTTINLPDDWRDQLGKAFRAEHVTGKEPIGLIESWAVPSSPTMGAGQIRYGRKQVHNLYDDHDVQIGAMFTKEWGRRIVAGYNAGIQSEGVGESEEAVAISPNRLDQAVWEGLLTQEQADALKASSVRDTEEKR